MQLSETLASFASSFTLYAGKENKNQSQRETKFSEPLEVRCTHRAPLLPTSARVFLKNRDIPTMQLSML